MTALNVLYRDVTAAVAALVITMIVSLSFVQSTATAPAWRADVTAAVHSVEAPKLQTLAG
jgi:hypothetical protein